MARDLPTNYAPLTEATVFRPVILVYLSWPDGAVRAWSGYGSITFGGETFLGVGELGNISPIAESDDLGANGITLTLSGIPSANITNALANDAQGRSGKIWLGAMNSAGAFAADPYLIFDGLIDVTAIDDDGTVATISVTLEKELIDRRAISRRSTHEDQQIDYPGDLFFDYVAGLQDKSINWGGKSLDSGGDVGRGDNPNKTFLR
jgi:hypothetical protein